MQTAAPEQEPLRMTIQAVLTIINAFTGRSRGREDDEHPLPPGPWDPVIRLALERAFTTGPRPEPGRFADAEEPASGLLRAFGLPVAWRLALASVFARHPELFDAIGGGHRFGEEAALNPQPLPPRYAFFASVARIMAERAELLQELADSIAPGAEERGIIIVGGRISRFCDEWCGNGFQLKWPFPGPPPAWFSSEVRGTDLMVIGAQLYETSQESFSPVLRQSLAGAAGKFVTAGLAKVL